MEKLVKIGKTRNCVPHNFSFFSISTRVDITLYQHGKCFIFLKHKLNVIYFPSLAVGCEMFADGLSLIILNKTKCEENSECSGEKEIDLMKHGCSILPNRTQYLHNDTWKALEIRNGSFETVYRYTLHSYTAFLQVFRTLIPTKLKGMNQPH